MKQAIERFQSVRIASLRHRTWLNTEMRVALNQDKVNQYAAEKKKGTRFPPPVVFVGADGVYRVGDGFHRIEADYNRGVTEVECDIRPGEVKDAILHNLTANRESNGLPFSNGDLSKSCKRLLTDPAFEGWTRMQIHKAIGCNYSLVSKVALKLGLPRCKTGVRPVVEPEKVAQLLHEGKTHKEIADELGVSERTTYRREISSRFEDCPHCRGTGKVLKEEFRSGS
jgi:hypothetical protein